MDFKYFKGPNADMSDLLDNKTNCSICGKIDYCFELDFAITKEFDQEEKEGKLGCYSCLREGKFEFWHDTEFGMLDEDGLTKVYNHNMNNPPAIAAEILTEMMRTPRIVTWQQELWLTHCNDFMIYKGTWEPKDFYSNSKDNDGRNLFIEMTNEDLSHLWDESLAEGQNTLTEWYPTYYVFQCRHCNTLRGNWDCD
ncbi:MAG: CbrC family protein [Bacteroidetes bacterium]|nr:CbrC family protein [Bacteroidota bacterium]